MTCEIYDGSSSGALYHVISSYFKGKAAFNSGISLRVLISKTTWTTLATLAQF